MSKSLKDTDMTMVQMEDALNVVTQSGLFSTNTEESIDVKEEEIGDDSKDALNVVTQSGLFSTNTEESIDVKEEEIGDDSKDALNVVTQSGLFSTNTEESIDVKEEEIGDDSKELRIVMIGKTGAGKSATANSLLQVKLFNSNNYGESVTVECELGTRLLDNGKTMKVIDTPGIFDTRKSSIDTAKEIVRCINLSSPGPHIFLVVLKIGRFTPEENDTIQQVKDLFGEDVINFVIIVFTGKESLDFDGLTINQQIENSPKDLRSLVDQCKGRVATINNRDTPTAIAKDVEAIIDLMLTVVKEYDGGYYTGEMFAEAERAYKEKLRKIEEEKHKIERELEQREQEIEQKRQEMEAKDLENKEELKRIKIINDENEEELVRKKLENEREAERMMEEVKKEKLSNEKMQEEFKKIQMQQNERARKLELEAQKTRDEADRKMEKYIEDTNADKKHLQKEILRITDKMLESQQKMEKKNAELQQMNAASVLKLHQQIVDSVQKNEQDRRDADKRTQTIINKMNAERNHELMELQKARDESQKEMLNLMKSKDDRDRERLESHARAINKLQEDLYKKKGSGCNIL